MTDRIKKLEAENLQLKTSAQKADITILNLHAEVAFIFLEYLNNILD